jgi:hypothetical protein
MGRRAWGGVANSCIVFGWAEGGGDHYRRRGWQRARAWRGGGGGGGNGGEQWLYTLQRHLGRLSSRMRRDQDMGRDGTPAELAASVQRPPINALGTLV